MPAHPKPGRAKFTPNQLGYKTRLIDYLAPDRAGLSTTLLHIRKARPAFRKNGGRTPPAGARCLQHQVDRDGGAATGIVVGHEQ